jgi:GAF domain-containing protein/CHASE1-domain containing sensor protein
VLVIGTTGAWITALDDRHDTERREELVADQTANLVTATVQQLSAAISGVSALPDESGAVDSMAFEAYALGAVAESPFTRLAYAPVVPAAERTAFEASAGRPITDNPGGDAASRREWHLPVRWVMPHTDDTEVLLGYDLAADPVRLEAAETSRDRGTTVITETIAAQPNGDPAVFVIHPVYRAGTERDASVAQRRAAILGYVSTSVHGQDLLDAIDTQVTAPLGIRIEDAPDGERDRSPTVLAETVPAPGAAAVVERTMGGQRWRITVDDRQPVTSAGPWWTLLGTVALALALAVLGWRVVRHQRDVDLHVTTMEGIAGLGRSLAAVGSVEDLYHVVETEVPGVLGARAARFHESAERDGPASPDRRSPPGVVVWQPVSDEAATTVAALEVAWEPSREPRDLTLAALATVAEMCGQALVRARLTDRSRRDAVTSRLLAGLAEASTIAGTTDQVARTLVERAADVPGAKTAHIGLLSDDKRSLVVVHHGLATPADRIDVLPLDHRWPLVEAYHRARPVLLGDLDALAVEFPAVVDGLRSAGLAAVASLPLLGDDGRPFGALSMAWSEPQRYDAELVDVLHTTADLCASSLDRARATDRAQARSSALATLAGHLSASSSFEDVGTAIVEHATPVLGADYALVGVVTGDRLRLLAPSGSPLDGLRSDPGSDADIDLALDRDSIVRTALERCEVVTFPTLDDIADRERAQVLAEAGLHGGACAPMMGSDGEPTGIFLALWADPPRFDDALLARLSVVADLCAQSTERSRLFDAEHRVRRDLQQTVMVRAPVLDGLDVATRYRPAAQSVGMGGDWYDAITLEGERLCLIVGDVSGHGVGAIAEMTQIRTVVHTLVAGGMPLSEILLRTSGVMQRDGLGYATVLVAIVDPWAASLRYVTAGHPPPLVRRPGGTVDTLTGGRHSVLGIDLAPKPPGYVPFPVGSTLVMYTDGLIERRGTVIDVSVADLADELRSAAAVSADALADHLLDHGASSGASDDDVALVVTRRTR